MAWGLSDRRLLAYVLDYESIARLPEVAVGIEQRQVRKELDQMTYNINMNLGYVRVLPSWFTFARIHNTKHLGLRS